MYQRKFTLEINEVLSHVPQGGPVDNKGIKRVFNGELININSLRLHTFKISTRCVSCGLEGTHFAAERTARKNQPLKESYHLNLYAMKNGKEILMTKDHIKPLSKGGPDELSNLQTMCCKCNSKKGSTYVEDGK